MRSRLSVIACTCLIAVACAEEPSVTVQAKETVSVRLRTGPQGGGFFPLGEQLAKAIGSRVPGVLIKTVSSSGAVSNVHAVQDGTTDLGFTFADVAYIAYSGQLTGQTRPFERLRAIAVLQVTPIALAVRADLPIHSPADLRGRRVGVGPSGSGTALTARLILKAFGVDTSVANVETIGFQEAAGRLADGSLDAMFDNAINQSDSLRRAIESGARLVPIEGPSVETLRREYPFLKLTMITRRMYQGLASSVHTIGVDGVLICRSDMDERLVYNLTKQLFVSIEALSGSDALRSMDVSQASATPIPLHDGAARYYRERELSR